MDSFTVAVVAGDIIMCLAFIALIVLDKKRQLAAPVEPVKPTGKRRA